MAQDFSLPIADDALIAEVDESSPVSAGVTLADLDDWERHLVPENDPAKWPWWRNERQTRNDCQANALTTCLEVIEHRRKRLNDQLSRMFAYQQSEVIDGSLGRDRGTTIQAGVKVARTLGCPTSDEYPYSRYTGSRSTLDGWSRPVLQSAATRKIATSIPAPAWDEMLAYVVMGHPVHWGTWWPLQWGHDRVVRRYTGRHGRGGHATAIVWVEKRGSELLAKVANSHGDGFFYVDERAYEEMRSRRNSPFGAYVLQGDDEPFERHVFI
jgi:hypothetical protein